MPNDVMYDRLGALQTLDARGWTQGEWESEEGVCLHQAIRLCSPQKGDAFIIEQVYQRRGHGTEFNDRDGTTRADVVAVIKESPDITDEELEQTFGPQWQTIVRLVRISASLTAEQADRLAATWAAAGDAARAAAVGDLIGQHGFEQHHYDTLVGPWESVMGPINGEPTDIDLAVTEAIESVE